jgi:hypothetical protein
MSVQTAKFDQHIISFERGILYLKLREEFNASTMEIHCTLAKITGDDVKVVKADSKGEISSTSMILSDTEMTLLAEGWRRVLNYWENDVLPYRHVLLNCGCHLDWKPWTEEYPEDAVPYKGQAVWCNDHEEVEVYRFMVEHFEDEPVVEPVEA